MSKPMTAETLTVDQMRAVARLQIGREMHPLTCPDRGEPPHEELFDEMGVHNGTLYPTSRYLVCPACGYRQDYTHPAAVALIDRANTALSAIEGGE